MGIFFIYLEQQGRLLEGWSERATTTCGHEWCRVRFIPLKGKRQPFRKAFLLLRSGSGLLFILFLKEDAGTGFQLFPMVDMSRLTRSAHLRISYVGMEKVFQSCYNFFLCSLACIFFSRKLKMHKTGIEWETVEDPFNRSLAKGKIFWFLDESFLLLSPSGFNFLGQFSLWQMRRGWIQEWPSQLEMMLGSSPSKAIPFADERDKKKNSIKHLIYHLHGIKSCKT